MREYLQNESALPKAHLEFTLVRALKASTGRGLVGHGYEANQAMLEALTIFHMGKSHDFLMEALTICPEFHKMIWHILDYELPKMIDSKTEASTKACIQLQNLKPERRLYLAYGSNMEF